MGTLLQSHNDLINLYHFKRSRLNHLLTEAARHPLVMICAGAGYGKTSAVYDFAQEYQAITVWIQLSERDNVSTRFWENFTHTISRFNLPLSEAMKKLGFPDTGDKLNQYISLVQNHVELKRLIIVLDDFHFLENPAVLRFAERALNNMLAGTTAFVISRSTPRINIAGMIAKNWLFNLNENDLRFTENELAQYFHSLDIFPQPENLHEIMQDTEGWAFAINLIVRSYQKAPGYGGYLRNAMKSNIFQLMESEIWDEISEHMQNFLVRLSLIGHLSVDLIMLLAKGDEELISDLERQSAYVRRDYYINAYHIHPLFLEFLASKQKLLSKDIKHETYVIAGNWCNMNGFKIDALSYYEKIEDYEAVISILFTLPPQIPYDIAKFAAAILDRAPAQAFKTVKSLAAWHINTYSCQGLWQEAAALAEQYEGKFLKLPENDRFKDHALSYLYFAWGYLRVLKCLTDDRYDFDLYFEKFYNHMPENLDLTILKNRCPGPWIISASSSKKGAPEEYIASLSKTLSILSRALKRSRNAENELAKGELIYYKGDTRDSETFFTRALEEARKNRQFDVMHRVLFYFLRLSVAQGNFEKAEQALKQMSAHLGEIEYTNRFVNYDISLCWYYCILGLPEKTVHWLKGNFSPYVHAGFIENFGNIMKAEYCYATRNYSPLLAYIEEMKQRESFLFGRVEMLAMEACVHYKMKNKKKAFAALKEAYDTASPNDLVMPFIELGKDMRTLTASAMKKTSSKKSANNQNGTPENIPDPWLKNINRRAASYAKRLGRVISGYKQFNRMTGGIVLSPRETEILNDLSFGLSRAEIAVNRDLTINTVKMIISSIYSKAGAENLADLIRIAVEKKMIKS